MPKITVKSMVYGLNSWGLNKVFKSKPPANTWFRIKPPTTPRTPPMKPIAKASVRNIRCICPLERPFVDNNPISRLLMLKETSETVEPRYHATKKTGSETTIKLNKVLEKLYWKLVNADPSMLFTEPSFSKLARTLFCTSSATVCTFLADAWTSQGLKSFSRSI